MQNSCDGCTALKFETFSNGKIAARCFGPWPPCNGTGRVINNPARRIITSKIKAPAWCRGKMESKETSK